MAYLTALNLPYSSSQDPRLSSTFPKNTSSSPEIASFSFPVKSKRNLQLQVTAVAKFKGTVIREQHLTEMIEKKIIEAKEVCAENQGSDECKVAWDEVEEVSQAKADLRRKMEKHDPLESFCQENPETEECRIYED